MSIYSTVASASKESPQGLKPLSVSLRTARALVGVGNTKLWELINKGTLRTIMIGRKRFVVYESLELLLTSNAVAPDKADGGDCHVKRARAARRVRP